MTTDERLKLIKKQAKRIFWIVLSALLLFIAAVYALKTYTDLTLYLPTFRDVFYSFRCAGRKIQHRSNGNWENFTVYGVEIDAMQPSTDYETYQTWFADLTNMNANTVYVHMVMPPDFYRALHDHNTDASSPLYLLQGVELTDQIFADMSDAESGKMVTLLQREGRLAIDAVHGRRSTLGYRVDVSDETLGFLVGNHWNSDFVQYTDHISSRIAGHFNGRYAAVWEMGSAMETLLARVFNDLFFYETNKYQTQHIIGFGNTQKTDLLYHDNSYAIGLNEHMSSVNTMHISTTDLVNTGVFAAYSLDMGVYQGMSFDPEYISYLDSNGQPNPARYYMESLANVHAIPVIMSCIQVSSAQGVSGLDEILGYHRGGLKETQQAEALSWLFQQAVQSGTNGGCIGSYLDQPRHTAWNRRLYVDPASDARWLDALDSEQSLGIVALEPGEFPVCMVDGDVQEWNNIPFSLQQDNVRLQTVWDEKFFYLHIWLKNYNPSNDVVYLSFDITPNSGARRNEAQQLTFDRNMDFLLSVNGKQRAKLTVQEYYDSTSAFYSHDFTGQQWFVHPNNPYSNQFSDICQYVRPTLFPLNAEPIPYAVRDAGILPYGNANPVSNAYNSLANYYINGEHLELRIPWGLLNFTDPSKMRILGDFYQLGDSSIPIDNLYIGLAVFQSQELISYPSASVALTGWENDGNYRTRKKAAYFTLQQLFEEYQKS
ncbi:MAG: hypothetical protein RRZ24_01035 [Clostridia bacterium]